MKQLLIIHLWDKALKIKQKKAYDFHLKLYAFKFGTPFICHFLVRFCKDWTDFFFLNYRLNKIHTFIQKT